MKAPKKLQSVVISSLFQVMIRPTIYLNKTHFTHINTKALPALILILLLGILSKEIHRQSTFSLIFQYWLLQEVSLDHFGSDISTYKNPLHPYQLPLKF